MDHHFCFPPPMGALLALTLVALSPARNAREAGKQGTVFENPSSTTALAAKLADHASPIARPLLIAETTSRYGRHLLSHPILSIDCRSFFRYCVMDSDEPAPRARTFRSGTSSKPDRSALHTGTRMVSSAKCPR